MVKENRGLWWGEGVRGRREVVRRGRVRVWGEGGMVEEVFFLWLLSRVAMSYAVSMVAKSTAIAKNAKRML